MSTAPSSVIIMRRVVLRGIGWGGLGVGCSLLGAQPGLGATGDTVLGDRELVERLVGRNAIDSPRVRIEIPPVFSDGYRVPLALSVDSPMVEADHVRCIHVLAPQNPIVVAAVFRFTPQSGRAAISTRIRLAKSQDVLAVAEMSDGALLMARTWVTVDSDGCA